MTLLPLALLICTLFELSNSHLFLFSCLILLFLISIFSAISFLSLFRVCNKTIEGLNKVSTKFYTWSNGVVPWWCFSLYCGVQVVLRCNYVVSWRVCETFEYLCGLPFVCNWVQVRYYNVSWILIEDFHTFIYFHVCLRCYFYGAVGA